ncbi:hypothetical protein GJW-30_1_00169 [Variibacter gotjawalensis]|uniref:TNase-like domain-containing protein n=1 Tax=Variibacter gotjawalensis TaxID=1333996 RepID=A0A0S3PPG5_9BRAD|nr:nuclease-like protein [Variibacter gotjawalensis]BAT57662.1 hypothetical protein GJW-30_1_00169 [Variibacter gotjawalensis]
MVRDLWVGLLAVVVAVTVAHVAAACGAGAQLSGTVAAVDATGTLSLSDGRQIRLAGVVVGDDVAAQQYLIDTIIGRDVVLRGTPATRDRYGRIEAYVFAVGWGLPGKDLDRSVQRDMVEKGLVRVSARISDRACAAEFLTSESQARQAGRGLWADARWRVLKADEPAKILSQRGAFALVEGKVLSVREVGGSIYVNFGRRWTEDFTVTVAKRNAAALGGLDVKRLDHKLIRVRGWVEERGGPWIEVTRPEQIELIRN